MGPFPRTGAIAERWGRVGLGHKERGLSRAAPLRAGVRGLSRSFGNGPGTQGAGLQMESVPYQALGGNSDDCLTQNAPKALSNVTSLLRLYGWENRRPRLSRELC